MHKEFDTWFDNYKNTASEEQKEFAKVAWICSRLDVTSQLESIIDKAYTREEIEKAGSIERVVMKDWNRRREFIINTIKIKVLT